jgi:midasin (ATPase involved in ribosome maturation)
MFYCIVTGLRLSSWDPHRIIRKITMFFYRHSAVLLEGVARAVEGGEPVLLVGETGVGKTASVQFLAEQTGR